MFFKDIKIDELGGDYIVLDLDGTLVSDGGSALGEDEARVLKRLVVSHGVYLLTNKKGERASRIAGAHGMAYIAADFKKPDWRIARFLPQGRAVVVGDKILTDGFFAWVIGARFVKVEPLRSAHESRTVRLLYSIDAFVERCLALFMLIRPLQWVKNGLLFAPLFFAGELLNANALGTTVIAVVAFSFAASAGYVFNDLRDAERDRLHPKKKFRPIASGRITSQSAYALCFTLAGLSLMTAILVPKLIPWLVVYFFGTALYTVYIKELPIFEFIFVPVLYVVRVLAGGAVVGVPVTEWLVLMVFFATLFITVGRRYAEWGRETTRHVLKSYPEDFMRTLPACAASLVLVSYVLYTLVASPYQNFMYSTVFVVLGVLWYLRGVYAKDGVEHPDEKLWADPVLLITVGAWILFCASVIYVA